MGPWEMSFFSVVIPTYNRVRLIRKALDSVLGQDYQDFEIIVVDDGSTDGTEHVLECFAGKIRIFHQENHGPGAARNLGAQKSRGEYIAFLDSDDCWFPWTLATYARMIAEMDRPNVLCGALIRFRLEGEIAAIQSQPVTSFYFPDYFAAGRHGLYCGSGQMVVRRDTLLAVGGFADGKFNAEDHDLVMRLGVAPGFVNVTAPAMIAYRQHSEAATRDLAKTYTGARHLLQMEQAGRYPGGKSRRRDRWQILSQHIRSLTLELLREKEYRKAWALYQQTFVWNLALGRFRYLAGFPLQAALKR
jgi:glycosyltransferase involved in cell wall biosynthesis